MHGFQHKRMGVAAGIGILAYTILAKAPPEMTIIMVTAPIGVMLPDIDHDASKIGRTRKSVVGAVKFAAVAAVLAFVGFSYKSGGMWNALTNLVYVGGIALIITIIENNKHVKKQLGFITKHRGIMHTLVPPALLWGSTLWTTDSYFVYGMLGLSLGYVVHLLGDMGTSEGAPILWPLTKNNLRYTMFITNKHSAAIEFLCNLWCVSYVVVGIYYGIKGGF